MRLYKTSSIYGKGAAIGVAAAMFCLLSAESAVAQPVSATVLPIAHTELSNPKRIEAAAYNQARNILARAGSQTAARSQPVHGTTKVPVGQGTSLLAAARDEFRRTDRNLPSEDKQSGMSIPHYNAINDAARVMGIDSW
ncbi:hypothetical protein OG203_44185 [Nocardia sp. NBC_01499]|uniref:hypothetical protein n=1 Tax=Nocardia sp. NBC_01499 TaxID=2903597 RepID=UPI003863AD6B